MRANLVWGKVEVDVRIQHFITEAQLVVVACVVDRRMHLLTCHGMCVHVHVCACACACASAKEDYMLHVIRETCNESKMKALPLRAA